MTTEEIADVVAWLSSHREGPAPGQPASPAETGAGTETTQLNQQ
jgi:hypothetical protein